MEILQKIHHRICEAYRAGGGLAMFFDYDGTLAPIRPTPEEAILPPPVRRALKRLESLSDVFVGIISGRALNNLRHMVDLDSAFLAGTSGIEIDLRGRHAPPVADGSLPTRLNSIAEVLRNVSHRYAGTWIERKPLGITLHYRAVHPELAGPLRDDSRFAMAAWADEFRVEDVTLGIEVVPQLGRDKGTAVREMLEEAGGQPYCVYFGDAANDVPAFEVIESLDGLSIGVGPEAPPASMHLAGPEQVSLLLTMLTNSILNADQSICGEPSAAVRQRNHATSVSS